MLEGSISCEKDCCYQSIHACSIEFKISQLAVRKCKQKRLKTETKILNCEAKAVIDNNVKFWNEERSSLFSLGLGVS